MFFNLLSIICGFHRRATHAVPLPRKNDPFGSLCVVENIQPKTNNLILNKCSSSFLIKWVYRISFYCTFNAIKTAGKLYGSNKI